ncbi:hypothetical protein ACIQU4_27795 [Streptomyces sp. NPDC090741]|uniref:hypothetical protein n=1 Tax=Streptomyces sp. NPDC090741 TaxID=3365967 RepID=UPI0038294826
MHDPVLSTGSAAWVRACPCRSPRCPPPASCCAWARTTCSDAPPTLHQAASVISGAGAAVLDQLPLLFALGVGFRLNRSPNSASRVLSCALSYLILARAVIVLNPLDKPDTPAARWPYGALSDCEALDDH